MAPDDAQMAEQFEAELARYAKRPSKTELVSQLTVEGRRFAARTDRRGGRRGVNEIRFR